MKTIRYNGRLHTVATPRSRRGVHSIEAAWSSVLASMAVREGIERVEVVHRPCAGRELIKCENGPRCKGHDVRILVLKHLYTEAI